MKQAMTKKHKNKLNESNDFCVATEAAFELVRQAIAVKRKKGEYYPSQWEDPEWVRENIAPALLNKMLEGLP
ncbi:hypothetical protein QUB21_29295 [Microcoleus sp. AT9b-C4]|uniref:hypothetical protein n=2 Tax=Microcoleus TaxID=44471 RepID=UPI002FD4E07E